MKKNINDLINIYDDKNLDFLEIVNSLYKYSDMSYEEFAEYCRNKIIEKYNKLQESSVEDKEVVEYFSKLPHEGYVDSEGDFVYPKELM